jgi:hypothetical protein
MIPAVGWSQGCVLCASSRLLQHACRSAKSRMSLRDAGTGNTCTGWAPDDGQPSVRAGTRVVRVSSGTFTVLGARAYASSRDFGLSQRRRGAFRQRRARPRRHPLGKRRLRVYPGRASRQAPRRLRVYPGRASRQSLSASAACGCTPGAPLGKRRAACGCTPGAPLGKRRAACGCTPGKPLGKASRQAPRRLRVHPGQVSRQTLPAAERLARVREGVRRVSTASRADSKALSRSLS